MMPQTVRFITVGSLKESYLREAVAEYRKRLSGLRRNRVRILAIHRCHVQNITVRIFYAVPFEPACTPCPDICEQNCNQK